MSLQKLKDNRVIGVRLSPDKKEILIHDVCCNKFKTILTKQELRNLIDDLSWLYLEMPY